MNSITDLVPHLSRHPNIARDDPRRMTAADVRSAGDKLMRRSDPTDAASAIKVAVRRLPHVYPAGIVQPLDRSLEHAVTNGARLFLQGATVGVGLSTLLTDYANAFNLKAHERGDPRRIAYLQLG